LDKTNRDCPSFEVMDSQNGLNKRKWLGIGNENGMAMRKDCLGVVLF